MARDIIQLTEGFRIFINQYGIRKKKLISNIIEYTHVLGSVEKITYEEKHRDDFNYITKDHKEQVRKNKEIVRKNHQVKS